MDIQTILTFALVAGVAILSPGPATLLALRNSINFGVRTVVWSSLGNVSGLFCLSAAAMLGLGVLLKSSELLFNTVKFVGAIYLFYIGIRQFFGPGFSLNSPDGGEPGEVIIPTRKRLYVEALLTAITNPKATLFFTALFPQFINPQSPLISQFFVLTGVFMILSFCSLLGYALLAVKSRQLLSRPGFGRWVNRGVGAMLISFGIGLLFFKRPGT